MALVESLDGNNSSIQFLEVHCILVDIYNRNIDLKELTANCEGYNKFGEWTVNKFQEFQECQECTAMWMLCFTGQYVNLFNDIGFKWRLKDQDNYQSFQKVHELVYDPAAADMYRKMQKEEHTLVNG